MSEQIILQITQSPTIETEVDATRRYLYARQLYMQAAKEARALGMLSSFVERETISKFWNSLDGDE